MIIKNLQTDFGAVPGTDILAACQAASADISSNPYSAYKLIIPSGDYYLSDTWEIRGILGRTILIEGEVGSGVGGTILHPHSSFSPTVMLGPDYVSLIRTSGGLNDSFVPSNIPPSPPGFDPNAYQHLDYRPLIRLRGLNENSAFRGIAIWGRDQNLAPRLGKGLWVDFIWDSGSNTYIPSNGLLVEECSVSGVYALLEKKNLSIGQDFYPWLPAVSIQVGSFSTDGATRQVSNVRLRRSIVHGGQGSTAPPYNDPFQMRTDLGIWFGAGNMKNYTITDCNILFCRYGIRTAGSGYTNIMSCDFAGCGAPNNHWRHGADLLVPQAHVNVIGCGSEGSSRFVQGDGAPGGFGSLNIDSCYWASDILPKDLADTGFIIRNANQSVYIRGLWAATYGGGPGAGRTAIQVNFNQYRPAGLELVNSHLEGVSQYLGDPLIYDGSNNLLLPQLEEISYIANSEDVRLFLQNNTSRVWSVNQFPVPLQNYDHSGVKRIGGHAVKVTSHNTPQLKLEPWHHTVVADATAGNVELLLPEAHSCQGREYVIKRLDQSSNANEVKVLAANVDQIDAAPSLKLANLRFRRLVSDGKQNWMVVGQ
jgi:hypothetical protein